MAKRTLTKGQVKGKYALLQAVDIDCFPDDLVGHALFNEDKLAPKAQQVQKEVTQIAGEYAQRDDGDLIFLTDGDEPRHSVEATLGVRIDPDAFDECAEAIDDVLSEEVEVELATAPHDQLRQIDVNGEVEGKVTLSDWAFMVEV